MPPGLAISLKFSYRSPRPEVWPFTQCVLRDSGDKTMKRFLILTVVVALFALVGCPKEKAPATSGDTAAEEAPAEEAAPEAAEEDAAPAGDDDDSAGDDDDSAAAGDDDSAQ